MGRTSSRELTASMTRSSVVREGSDRFDPRLAQRVLGSHTSRDRRGRSSRDYNRRYKSFPLMIPPELARVLERNRYVEGFRANTSTSRGCVAFDVGPIR
jgi:hypothetical protein